MAVGIKELTPTLAGRPGPPLSRGGDLMFARLSIGASTGGWRAG